MAQVVYNCPRCRANNTTFDVVKLLQVEVRRGPYFPASRYEVFCVCRACQKGSILVADDKSRNSSEALKAPSFIGSGHSVNEFAAVVGYISLKDRDAKAAPEHLPDAIKNAFEEGARCLGIQCFNAAGTMFRLCVDLATKPLLPSTDVPGLNHRTRRDLGLRLGWLFEQGLLPRELAELSACVREDGNDGAHAGTLTQVDADDLLDFTEALLERLFTEPARLRLATERRSARRTAAQNL